MGAEQLLDRNRRATAPVRCQKANISQRNNIYLFSRKPVGLEVSTLNLKPYRLFAVNVSCNIYIYIQIYIYYMHENVARDSFAKHFFFRNFGRRKNITEKLFLLSIGSKNKNLFTQSIMSTVGLFKNWNMRQHVNWKHFLFKQSRWGNYDPAQPSNG